MTVTDALGRDVKTLGTCARCGASIKYIFPFEGKTYGSTCIEAVSGVHPNMWERNNEGMPDEAATKQAEIDREAARLDRLAQHKARQAEIATIQAQNAETFKELINVLKNVSRHPFDFCDSMRLDILEANSSTELQDILSPNQIEAVRDIWSKCLGGRRNSKKYKAEYADFAAKYLPADWDE